MSLIVPIRPAGADAGEVVGLPLLAERVPGAGVDHSGRHRVDPDRRQFQGEGTGQGVGDGVSNRHGHGTNGDFGRADAREDDERAALAA
jgi:hypothetical protein